MNVDTNKKINIGVFFGSKTPEHEVSIITGQLIISELKKLGYNVTPIYLDKEAKWFIGGKLDKLRFFNDIDEPDKKTKLLKNHTYYLDTASQNQLVFRKKGLSLQEIIIDVAFPAFHGPNGEDGTMQGIFELFNVPYIGCDVTSSAIAMDKILCKLLFQSAHIPTTKFLHFNINNWEENKLKILEDIKQQLKWPVFIKPARSGSSIGITKVKDFSELQNACEVALHYDSKVLAEEGVENLADITCAVLGNGKPRPSLIQESVFQGEFFNYENKYIEDGGAQLGNAQNSIIIPARLDEKTTKDVQDMAVKIFKLLGCAGTARVDFLYDKRSQIIYANEVNTLPGTLYHHLWKKSDLEIGELLEELLKLAMEKHKQKNKISFTFKSDILKYANSIKLQLNNKK